MAPYWKDAGYESLSSEVQKLYDAYVEAYERARDLGQKLQVGATGDWLAKHPNGMDGKYISFNVNGGRLRWTMVSKKPQGNYKTAGEDVPSRHPSNQDAPEASAERQTKQPNSGAYTPAERLATLRAKKTWQDLGTHVRASIATKMPSGTRVERAWEQMSFDERRAICLLQVKKKPTIAEHENGGGQAA